MHLWFLAVYLVVVSLTPIAIAAQRRWGLLVPAVLAVGVAAVDAASIGRPRAVRRLAELPAVLGGALSARNRLARWAIGRSQTRAAGCRVGGSRWRC